MSRRMLVAAILGSAVALVVAVAPAFANTSNATSINVSAVKNPNGTVTVTVNGDWTWPAGQNCTKRYGTGWVISWWGIGSTKTPSNNFTLTSMSAITAVGQGENGTTVGTLSSQQATGWVQFPAGYTQYGGEYFWVPANYNGQELFTQSFCDSVQQPNQTTSFNGTYTATATYPNAQDVPSELCVNTYDEHGTSGSPTKFPGKDFNPDSGNGGDSDNSIQQKQFVVLDNCSSPIVVVPAAGSIGPLGLTGLVALGALLLFGGQAVIRRRRRATVHVD